MESIYMENFHNLPPVEQKRMCEETAEKLKPEGGSVQFLEGVGWYYQYQVRNKVGGIEAIVDSEGAIYSR